MKSANVGNFKDVKGGGRLSVMKGGTQPSGKPSVVSRKDAVPATEFAAIAAGTAASGGPGSTYSNRSKGPTEYAQASAR